MASTTELQSTVPACVLGQAGKVGWRAPVSKDFSGELHEIRILCTKGNCNVAEKIIPRRFGFSARQKAMTPTNGHHVFRRSSNGILFRRISIELVVVRSICSKYNDDVKNNKNIIITVAVVLATTTTNNKNHPIREFVSTTKSTVSAVEAPSQQLSLSGVLITHY